MFKPLFKFTATLTLTLFFCISGVMASAKMEVPLGQEVVLQAETLQAGYDYKWVVNKGKDIINTQSGSVFNYIFDVQGEYEVNLALSDTQGNIKNTTVSIMVGGRYSKPANATGTGGFDAPLVATVSTLPTMDENGTVHILGDQGTVLFDIDYRPDVLEFRIDKDILVDSDADGIPNNDVDNDSDTSFLRAGIWRTDYKQSDAQEFTAEVTLVSSTGQKVSQIVKIVFDDYVQSDTAIKAVLDSLPPINASDRKIYIYDDKDTVAFYARRSEGKILEYRIDSNIFVDSDGDGNPSNDIDNRSDASFKTGDVWTTEYSKTGQQIIAQLIVVGPGGVASRIQREIVFIERPVTQVPETGETSTGIQLKADKEFVQKGDPIQFYVEGLTYSVDNYTFDWDFNGDGVFDQTIEGNEKASYIYDTPGTPIVTVHITDKSKKEGSFTREISVRDVSVTAANFDYTLDGLKLTFNNTSTSAATLSNKALTYTWSFGDPDEKNYEAQKAQVNSINPVYTYLQPGTYRVSLTVTDSEQVSDTKSVEVIVGSGETVTPPTTPTETEPSEGSTSLVGKIFKIILYVFLVIIALILLIVGGLLVFLKVQNPDLIFEELIDELKIKILGLLGMNDVLDDLSPTAAHSPGVTGGVIPPYHPQGGTSTEVKGSKPSGSSTSSGSGSHSSTAVNVNIDLSKSDAPVPEWMKTPPAPLKEVSKKPDSTVIEAELVENKIPAKPTPPPPASKPEVKPEPKPVAPSTPVPQPPKSTPAATPSPQVKSPQTPVAPVAQNHTPVSPVTKLEPKSVPPSPKPVSPAPSTSPVQPVSKPAAPAPSNPTPPSPVAPSTPQSSPPVSKPEVTGVSTSVPPVVSARPPEAAPSQPAPQPVNPVPPTPQPPKPTPPPGTPASAPEVKPVTPSPVPPTPKPTQAPTPGSAPVPPVPPSTPPKDLSKPDGPIPDWLKDE